MKLLKRFRQLASLRGQSLLEMAIILPLLLGMTGGAVDLARAYASWTTLESATRDAAEYLATTNAPTADARAAAATIVCQEVTKSATCSSPVVTIASVSSCSGATSSTCTPSGLPAAQYQYPGGTSDHPIQTGHVVTTFQFRTLVPWPLLPSGGMTLTADRTYSVAWGR